jgi:hypothetical protein
MSEGIGGGYAYLVVVRPDGGVTIDRDHPDGGHSGIAYGAETFEAGLVRRAVDRFRSGSSHPGRW